MRSPPANGARRGRSDLRSDRWSGEKEGGRATGDGTRGGEGGGIRGYKMASAAAALLLDGIDGGQRVRRRRKLRNANVLWWASIRPRKKIADPKLRGPSIASPLLVGHSTPLHDYRHIIGRSCGSISFSSHRPVWDARESPAKTISNSFLGKVEKKKDETMEVTASFGITTHLEAWNGCL
ncbi:hypothetical protein BHE74_00038211 [Ensete ventricosum]|nr:hypothetical protein BHE74_00038211 [Ensete ventricosum]